MRRLVVLTVVVCMVGLVACSDDDGKPLGEACDAHGECASGLCTIPTNPADGGAPQKVCTEPGVSPGG